MKKNTKKQIFNISIVIVLGLMMALILTNSSSELNFENIKHFFANPQAKRNNPWFIFSQFRDFRTGSENWGSISLGNTIGPAINCGKNVTNKD